MRITMLRLALGSVSAAMVALGACGGSVVSLDPMGTMGQGGTSSTTTSTSSGTGGGACAASTFLDLSNAPGAGSAYPKPTLSVTCDADFMYVATNGIPDYTFVQTTPNALIVSDATYKIPRNPAVAATTTAIPLLGAIGVAVNGMPMFGPNEAAQPANQAYGDPVYNGLLDDCLGHTSPQQYHYHALLVKCLIQAGVVAEPWNNPDPSTSVASPIIAYAYDGFPVYGPYECADAACSSVIEEQSSYVKTGDPTTAAWSAYTYTPNSAAGYLDKCNGHVGPKGDYHYHATKGFPYILGCYTGTAQAAGTSGGGAGGTGGGGGGGGAAATPKTCTETSDCTGACPPGSQACACAPGAPGTTQKVCVPTCSASDASCPSGGSTTLTCDATAGYCRPTM